MLFQLSDKFSLENNISLFEIFPTILTKKYLNKKSTFSRFIKFTDWGLGTNSWLHPISSFRTFANPHDERLR